MNNKENTISFTLRMPKELCDKIDILAKKNYCKTRTSYIIKVLSDEVKQNKNEER